jgi:hypothetical protein
MRIQFYVFSAVLMVSSAAQAAAPRVKCDIQTLRDAELCMDKVADARPSFEAENRGAASAEPRELFRALRLIGAETRHAGQAHFAGLMIEYGDETHIRYFKLVRGKDVAPVELYDLNLVDLPYQVKKPYSAEALNPNSYFLGLNGKRVDPGVYDEIALRFKDAIELERDEQ